MVGQVTDSMSFLSTDVSTAGLQEKYYSKNKNKNTIKDII